MKKILVAVLATALSLPVLAQGTTTTTLEEQNIQDLNTPAESSPSQHLGQPTAPSDQQNMDEQPEFEDDSVDPSTAPAVDAIPSAPMDEQRMEDRILEDEADAFNPEINVEDEE